MKCQLCKYEMKIEWNIYSDRSRHLHAKCHRCGSVQKLKQTVENIGLVDKVSMADDLATAR